MPKTSRARLSDLPFDHKCACGNNVALRKYHRDPSRTIVQSLLCKTCLGLKSRYGLTRVERDAMLNSQGGKCKACSTSISFDPGDGSSNGSRDSAVVDHCHSSNRVRGILCRQCNIALGNVQDNVQTLLKLVEYLRCAT